MPTVTRLMSLSLAVAACGGGSNDAPDAPIVLAPDAAVPGTTISIATGAAEPLFIGVRDLLPGTTTVIGTSGSSGTVYETEVHGPYLVTVVCPDSGGLTYVFQAARTLDDATLVQAHCGPSVPTTSHTVTAQVVQAGVAATASVRAQSAAPGWPLSLAVPEGSHDLVAMSRDHALLRRDLAVTGDLDLGVLDLAADGQPLVATPLTASNVGAGDTVVARLGVFTNLMSAAYLVETTLAANKVLPEALLSPPDRQELVVAAGRGGDQREVHRFAFHAGDPTAFALPDGIVGGRFSTANGLVTAHWDALPPHDGVSVSMYGPRGNGFLVHQLDLGTAFAAQASEVTLDTDLPGFSPAWNVATGQHTRVIFAFRNSGPGEVAMSSSFDFPQAAGPDVGRRLAVMTALRSAR